MFELFVPFSTPLDYTALPDVFHQFMRLVPAILIFLITGTQGFCAPLPVRAVQTSDQMKQFLVQGGDFKQRSAVLRMATELRETVLKALSMPLEGYPAARPLLFNITPNLPQESVPLFEIIEDPGGLKIYVKLLPLDEEPRSGIERAMLSLILREIALRSETTEQAKSSRVPPSPPRWLVDVLLFRHHHKDPMFSPARLRPVLDKGALPSLAMLLSRPENDWTASSEEEVDSARALFWMLNNQEAAKDGFKELLQTDFSQNPLLLLRRCFPSLGNSDASLEKEWTLSFASFGTQNEIFSLDGPQTELHIKRLLELDLTDPTSGNRFTVSMEQFADCLRLPGIQNLLTTRRIEWLSLRERSHFLYRDVIDVYIQTCSQLARGNTTNVTQRLRAATLERESIAARLERITDHLNWFEAVAAPRSNTSRIKEFYQLLNARPPLSKAVSAALDKAEKHVNAQAELVEINELLDAAKQRQIDKQIK